MASWRDRIDRLRKRFLGAGEEPPAPAEPMPPLGPVALNLGIDFGTSFTKVAFRDLGTDHSGIVTFGARSTSGALIPSVVMVGLDGRLLLQHADNRGGAAVSVRYLKMRLADPDLPEPLVVLDGTDLNSDNVIRALSSWYLASVLTGARDWILTHEADRIRGREIQWSANVGVPVEYYDSPAIDTFREVLEVAWFWATEDRIPGSLQETVSAYGEATLQIVRGSSDFHAIPEIAAAVQSFLTTREAVPGVYVYFDIGGGTVDGVAINYVNWGGQKQVNFYSGKVEPLGVEILAEQLGEPGARDWLSVLVEVDLDTASAARLQPWSERLRRMVASVIVTAKQKDGRDWQRDAFQDTSRPRRTLARLEESRMVPLIIFVGGGGAGSSWYQDSILSTYTHHKHSNAGIPPYELTEVPLPGDLDMNGLPYHDFGRFAIAYGLSVPFGEGPEVRLPSEISDAESRKVRKPAAVVSYEDSKDVYD